MRAAACQLVTAASGLPVTLGQMRAHLRMNSGAHDEDSLISAAISAATNKIEEECRRALITQSWRAEIDGGAWAISQPVSLPRPKLQTIGAVEYRNTAGNWTPWSSYRTREVTEPASLWLTAAPADVATPDHDTDAVWRVTYTAGYGASAKDVPDALCAAVKLLAATIYEQRENIIVGTIVSEIPRGISDLIAPFRIPWGGPHL